MPDQSTHHAPERIEPKRLGDYLEVMSKAVFFAGMNWGVVEKKWPGTREAFHGFERDGSCTRIVGMGTAMTYKDFSESHRGHRQVA